jgi:anti-sigma regulatory factor (Ser/Thr protein kinase)
MAEAAGFSAADADAVALATDEAVANVVEHAYAGRPGAPVQVRFALRPDELRVEVVDQGVTVDPRAMPRVDAVRYAAERRRGGFGVHLMTRLMDSVTYRRSGRSNVCCLQKRRPGGPHR